MVCCAIAMFILSQIYLTLATLREVLFGAPPARIDADGAASWRLGAEAPATPAPRADTLTLTPRRLTLAVVVAALSLTVAVAATRSEAIASVDAFTPTTTDICRWLPFGTP